MKVLLTLATEKTVSSTTARSGRNSALPALPSHVWPSASRTATWRPATRPLPGGALQDGRQPVAAWRRRGRRVARRSAPGALRGQRRGRLRLGGREGRGCRRGPGRGRGQGLDGRATRCVPAAPSRPAPVTHGGPSAAAPALATVPAATLRSSVGAWRWSRQHGGSLSAQPRTARVIGDARRAAGPSRGPGAAGRRRRPAGDARATASQALTVHPAPPRQASPAISLRCVPLNHPPSTSPCRLDHPRRWWHDAFATLSRR